jgi:peptidoglycan/LPS O-acetylase OafA/YrhL
MLRSGSVPLFVHGLLEYAAGALLVISPFLFGFDSGAAKATAIVTGVLVIVVAAVTEMPTGISKSLPLPVHILIDFVLAGFLIAAAFLFGFSDEGAPTAFFIALGVVHLLLTIATRFGPATDRG